MLLVCPGDREAVILVNRNTKHKVSLEEKIMKFRHFLPAFVLTFCVTCTALADRTLNRNEVLQIFQQLTSQPRKTWIPAGTIEAMRSEYKAPKITDENELLNRISQKVAEYQNSTNKRELSEDLQALTLDAVPFNVRYELANEYTMDSQVVVKYDGSRFYWEINVLSRSDSVQPDTSLRGNYMTNQFNLSGNARRIFVWDGEKYTTYFLPINQANVDTTNSVPHNVNGPLTAGVIPWGYGIYTYDNLAVVNTSAVETTSDSQTLIQLTINRSVGTEMVLTLDPAKNYAITNCITSRPDGSTILQQYSNYQQTAGTWIPRMISLEQYEANTSKLLSRDRWDITDVNVDVPTADAFKIDFKPAAMIQYSNPSTAVCRKTDKNKVNCATVAIKYVAEKFGKTVSDKKLASLLSGNNQTNLSAMKNFVNGLGLYCQAVNADLQSLKNLKDYQVIVHLSGKNHFAVLDELNKDAKMANFMKYTALLISDKPLEKQFAALPDAQMKTITGAAYACTKLLQEHSETPCPAPVGGNCGDQLYYIYYERWGCQYATSGTCSTSYMIRYQTSPCVYDSVYDACMTTEWTSYYMRACA